MLLTSAPAKIVEAFAAGGSKNTIPVPSSGVPGAASWNIGFPPDTMIDPTMGGVGPSGLDFNGIYFSISALSLWFNAGGAFPYDATFVATIGGYPKGARVLQAAGVGYWISTVDNNATDPDTGGLGWIPQGANTTSSVYASAQQTLAAGTSKVLFDSVEFDSGFWDSSHKRFTAIYPGKYRISGTVFLPNPAGQLLSSQIFKNGALVKNCFSGPQVSDGNFTLPFDAILDLAFDDFVELFVFVSQTAVAAGVSSGSSQAVVFAQLEYLGV